MFVVAHRHCQWGRDRVNATTFFISVISKKFSGRWGRDAPKRLCLHSSTRTALVFLPCQSRDVILKPCSLMWSCEYVNQKWKILYSLHGCWQKLRKYTNRRKFIRLEHKHLSSLSCARSGTRRVRYNAFVSARWQWKAEECLNNVAGCALNGSDIAKAWHVWWWWWAQLSNSNALHNFSTYLFVYSLWKTLNI